MARWLLPLGPRRQPVRSHSPGTGRFFIFLRRRAAGCLGLLALLACGASPRGADGTLLLVDDAGDEVRLAGPARRVASLIPATTEWLFALGVGDRVIGRTAWCDFPAEAEAVPSLGNGISPNLEAIVAAHPDLVLLYRSPANAAAAARLAELGIPVLQLRTDDLGDLDRLLELLGRALGKVSTADSLRAVIAAGLAEATVRPVGVPPGIFLIAWDQPPMTLGRGSFLSEIVERAGGRNIFDDLPAPSGTISIEAVVARAPDLVLTTSTDSVPAVARRPEWRVVPAVREGRFVRVHGSEFNRPGPRTPEAIRAMRRAIAEAHR